MAAAGVFIVIPAFVAAIAIQKHFVAGLTGGSVEMSRDMLTPAIVAALTAVDTPTICNAMELVEGRRATGGFTRRPVVAAFPALPPILGFARTATIRAAAPSTLKPADAKALKIAYYRQLEADEPVITVIEDTDDSPGIGAMWGEVNSAIHKGLGVQGCLTNGSIRDLDMLAPGFQLLAGSVGPSHAHVHVTAVGVPVTILGSACTRAT